MQPSQNKTKNQGGAAAENVLVFPKEADRPRLERYDFYDQIYEGNHFAAFRQRGEKDFGEAYNRLRYVVANFGRLSTNIVTDMLFTDKMIFNVQKNQDFLSALIEENNLMMQLYESGLANSRRGDDLIKIRVGPRNPLNPTDPSTVIIEQVPASYYFPQFGTNTPRNVPESHVLAWTFHQNVGSRVECYLHKETHTAGYVFHEIFLYDERQKKIIATANVEDFGFVPVEETGVDRPLVFHVPNVRSGSGYWGDSDYKDLVSLMFALNNRLTKTDNILDKHSDPILAVPPGVIDEEGNVRKEALNMFEVDNETAGFNKPEYIIWNANLDAAFKQIDKLIEMLFMFSETAPASVGLDKAGQAESGRALKFKLLRTIAKRNRKKIYYDQALKDVLFTAQELAQVHKLKVRGIASQEAEQPTIDWGDGVINDTKEMVEEEGSRIDQGTSSRADSISRLDGMTPEDAKAKVKEIDKENALDSPLPTKTTPEETEE